MTNVLIAYTNNVCSTPMIEYARLHKSIFVPVREHFDEHLFIEYTNDREQFCPQLANILSFLYSRKNCAFFDRNELIDYRYGQQLPSLLDKPHILFKWRCYPRKLPESHKIVDILAENNVIPAIMLRSSLSEQAGIITLTKQSGLPMSWGHVQQTIKSELIGKRSNGALRERRHFGESGYNWHDLSGANLIERYLSGELSICIKIGDRFGEGDRKYFCAFCRQNDGAWLPEPRYCGILRLRPRPEFLTDLGGLSDKHEQAVFIADVELVNDVHRRIIRRGMTIGLCSDHAPKCGVADALYLSPVTRLFEFFSLPADRELMGVQRRLAIGDSKGADEMVETRSKLMNDLARKYGKPEGNDSFAICLKDVFAGITIEATVDSVRAWIAKQELVDLGIEVVDSFVGPLHFCCDAI